VAIGYGLGVITNDIIIRTVRLRMQTMPIAVITIYLYSMPQLRENVTSSTKPEVQSV